jgi:hypothetical protein
MARFSERQGYKPIRDQIQKESVDKQTRTLLWNYLKIALWDEWEPYRYGWTTHSEHVNQLMRRMWVHYFDASLDNLREFDPYEANGAYGIIKRHFADGKWFEVYDFLEFVVQNWAGDGADEIATGINTILEKQLCAFRFVGRQIAPITDERELEAVDQAASNAPDTVRRHISRAVELLSDRSAPDYRNSVKEAISAIEALCQTVTGDKKGTLGKLLGKIEGLHPAFKSALSNMYGFTSDAEGIRHALLDESTLTFTDAKFFLVQAAAFVNYISGKQSDKKLKKKPD